MFRTGKRKFGGKSYDFYMFAPTKSEARKRAKQFAQREQVKFDHKGLTRITRGKDPQKPRGKRYLVWVRVE